MPSGEISGPRDEDGRVFLSWSLLPCLEGSSESKGRGGLFGDRDGDVDGDAQPCSVDRMAACRVTQQLLSAYICSRLGICVSI